MGRKEMGPKLVTGEEWNWKGGGRTDDIKGNERARASTHLTTHREMAMAMESRSYRGDGLERNTIRNFRTRYLDLM